jgi:hypothetical protein
MCEQRLLWNIHDGKSSENYHAWEWCWWRRWEYDEQIIPFTFTNQCQQHCQQRYFIVIQKSTWNLVYDETSHGRASSPPIPSPSN